MVHRALLVCAGLWFGGTLAAQQRPITGKVTGSLDGKPIAGATVAVVGSTMLAVTNGTGDYTVLVPGGPVTLSVRAVGYKRRLVNVRGDQGTADVTLEADIFNLEAIVVTGQATGVEQRNLANAVTTVSPENLNRAPTQTIESALQGKIPGALIQMNSGAPGGGGQINLRGVTTINAGVDPLIVVDGMVVSNDAIPPGLNAVTAAAAGGNASTQDNAVNRLADLNPADIEKVEVLKGASAAAIYGAQAANGVIMVTTRRGVTGAPRFTITQRLGTVGVSHLLQSRRFADSADAVAAFGHDSLVGVLCPAATGCPYFDNERALYGQHSLSYETDLTASGGSGSTNYFLSGLAKRDGGIAPNTGYDKQSLRANLDQTLSRRTRLTFNNQVVHSIADRGISNNDNTGTSTYLVLSGTPSFVDLRPRSGAYPNNPFAASNPLQTFAFLKNREDVWRVISTASLTLDALATPRHRLQVTLTGGIDYFAQHNDILSPPILQFEPNDGQPGTIVLGKASDRRLNLTGSVIHTLSPASGRFTATTSAGFQLQDADINLTSALGRQFLQGQQNVDQASSINTIQKELPTRSLGVYAQEEVLAASERLLFTLGIRGDRSSVNGNTDKFYLFPKGAVSYRFTQPTGFLDELKVRGAIGQTGNAPLFGAKFSSDTTGTIFGLPGTFISPIVGNPGVRPETNTEIEGGFDATLGREFANVNVTLYQKTITNLLLLPRIPLSTGQVNRVINGGKLRNTGVEIGAAVSPVRTTETTWIVRATFFSNRSKIVKLPVPTFQTGGFGTGLGAFQIERGKSATQIVGFDSTGAIVKVGDANPDFQMSLSSDLAYRRWSLSFLWDWKHGGDVIDLTQLLYDAGLNSADWNTTGQARFGEFLKGNTSAYVQDASYLKLREVTLSYELPASVTHRLFGDVRSARVSFSGRNLLRFTSYPGLDPEVSNFGNQAIARNIDVAPFPPNRGFFFSIDVGF